MSLSAHYHAHKPNVPIIMEDVFGWVREGNAFQVRVWLDDTEHDLYVGYALLTVTFYFAIVCCVLNVF